MCSRVIKCSVALVCVKNSLTTWKSPGECILLLKFICLQCGLLCAASCTDRAVHAFPNKMRRPPGSKYFLLSFNGTPHPLDYTGTGWSWVGYWLCVSVSQCYSSYMYAVVFQAQPLWDYSGYEAYAVQNASNCTKPSIAADVVHTLKASACSVCTGMCSLEH